MKTITMDYEEYQQEIRQAEFQGKQAACHRVIEALKLLKKDEKEEAVIRLVEQFEGLATEVIEALGLTEVAKGLYDE